jgi:uncharacterized protein YcbX
LFDFRGRVRRRPQDGSQDSPVRITLPDGTEVTSGQPDLEQILSGAFGRDVAFEEARPGQMPSGATAEEYWPDIAGLDYRDSVTDFQMPAGTFFDIAVVHLLTTATINRLRVLYPDGRFEVRRFRPNIVVSTQDDDAGFAENDWIGRTVAIGGNVRLAVTEPCPPLRHDHVAARRPAQGFRILRTAAQHNAVNAGVRASVASGGAIRRGDPVTPT